mgnify:CR=1 FL=1
MLPLLARHWRKLALVGVVVLAFLFGKFSTPAKVVTEVQTVTVERVVEKMVEVKAAAKVVYIDRVITKDGEVRERIVEREVTKIERKEDREATKEEERKAITIKENHATARVSLLVGADFAPAWQPIPNGGPLTVGVHAEFRVMGPVTVGVWGLHTGAVGGSIGLEF